MERYILIVAGGSGTRMKTDIPKQFIEINKLPVMMHTISNFYKINKSFNFIIVLPKQYINFWKELLIKHNFTINHKVITGGKTRFNSVKNGLKNIPKDSLVAIHDSVRPIISKKLINTGFLLAEKNKNAIPYVDIIESLRKITPKGSKIIKRENIKIIQTPQFFKSDIIKKAYLQRYKIKFTDDASVLETTGEKIKLFYGLKQNIKITTHEDLKIIEYYLKNIKL